MSIACGEKVRYIAQGGAYYTLAEPIGEYVPEFNGRRLVPDPQFVRWIDEHEAMESYQKIDDLKADIEKKQKELSDLEAKTARFKMVEE